MPVSEVAACYRQYATHCVDIAQHVPDSGRKAALLNMAQAWVKLADHIEQRGDVDTAALAHNPSPATI